MIRDERYAKCGEYHRSKTHCPYEHEFTPENTIVNKEGHRRCLQCRLVTVREATARYRARKRAHNGRADANAAASNANTD